MADGRDKLRLDVQPQPGGTHAVLVASGNKDIRRLLRETFEDDAYRVHEEASEDGAVAMALITRPALLVIDSELSSGDGMRACERLKEHRVTRDCKVVVISGYATPEEKSRATAAGADTFMAKPFSPNELVKMAQEVCGPSPRTRRAFGSGG